MKKNWLQTGRKMMASALAVLMASSGISMAAPLKAEAAGTPADREDNTIVYAVDCGDLNVNTAPADGPLGTHNSVTEQAYGADKATGYKWGIYETETATSGNGNCSVGGVSTEWTWPYELGGSDDKASKLSTNRYTKNQTEKGINPRNLNYKFELENGDYLVEVGFTDPWSVSDKPTLYADHGKSNQKVIASDINVSANGGVVTGEVTVTDGELTLNAISTQPCINMTYITIKKGGDSAKIQADYDDLTIRTAGITSDIDLPSTGSKYESAITWASDNPAVITVTTGSAAKVTRPASGEEDAEVTLTATLKLGDQTLTKTFKVTVKAVNEMVGAEYFDREAVEVTDAYYDKALEMDVENLLKLDADRLLAGFRETAMYASGEKDSAKIKEYMKNKERYGGGWENSLIGGHTLGHYMTAVAQGIVNPGLSQADKDKLTERLNELVNALADCQEKTVGTDYEGYLFGATLPTTSFQNDVDLQFDNVENSKANIATEAWVPWYTMHKILAGLTDAYEVAGNQKALEVANKLATWISNRANNWSEATQQKVLAIEYGGMNDALYQLYKVTNASNKADFLRAAHQFDETNLFENVLKGTSNILNNKHANTTIPKFLGALCRYEVTGEAKYLQYAESFWEMVIDRHTYVTGGNSENEHFGADHVLHGERTNTNNETCNTYNMLKLSRRLFVITGDKKYADYYENTLINAIMSSQNHETGMTMYFQPMATGYQKVFGTLDTNFWCCTGSGMENFTKLQDSIYFKKSGLVIVNQYLASKVTGDGYTITQTGDLSKSDTMTFKVEGTKINFKLKLRVPDWVKDGKVIVMSGDTERDYKVQDGYITVPNNDIQGGAEFTVKLPMEVKAYNLPDSEDTYAFKYGPYVLSAKLGKSKQTTGSHGVSVTVPTSKAVTSDTIGIRNAESVEEFIKKINQNLVKAEGSMNFTLKGTNFTHPFTTHYNQDEESYGIYWTYYIDEEGRGSEAILAEKAAKRLERVEIDTMAQVGRGQYESRFSVSADGAKKDGLVESGTGSAGADAPDLTRKANADGSFGYKMIVSEGEDNYLLLTYAKEDDGKSIRITVGNEFIAEEVLDSAKAKVQNMTLAEADQADYYQVLYKISANTIKNNVQNLKVYDAEGKEKTEKVITVTFAGKDQAESARICKSVSLMRPYNTVNRLTKVEYNGKALTAVKGTYTITVPYSQNPAVKFSILDPYGYVEVDGDAIDETQAKTLKTKGATTKFTVKVYAEDFKTFQTYAVVVKRDYTNLKLKESLVKSFTFESKTDGAAAVQKAAVPSNVSGASYSYQNGAIGKAITMPGTYGLKLMDDTKALGESYTVSFWMNSKAVGSAVNPTLTAGKFSPEYWMNLTLDARIWSKNGAYIDTPASGAYTANKWQNVVVVVNGAKAGKTDGTVNGTLYVDGEAVSTGDVAKGIMTQSGSKLYFGVNAWDAYFSGALDEVLIFKKALSDSEVQAIASKSATAASILKTNAQAVPGGKPPVTSNGAVAAKSVSVKAAGYTLKGNKITLKKGKKVTLKASVSPVKASQKVTFASNKKKVAAVSKKGVVTAKKPGTAKITVKTSNGKKKVITIKVVKKDKINKKLTLTKKSLKLKKGKTAQIKVKKMTAGTTSKLTYKSNKKKVATVDKYGVIKAKKKGKATITVKCGKKKAKIKVRV